LGGGEFCLILAECSGEEARIALDRVREASARQAGDGGAATCTASFGVAEFTRDGLGLDSLVQAADAALYQAKQQGRDRVVVRGEVVVLAAAVGNATAADQVNPAQSHVPIGI
jgi:diguanylate cyclase (GGDEF)-like protein